jgi:hypothetical protein
MAVWNRIKSLNVQQLFLLLKTFGTRLAYFFPTHRATLQTVRICEKLFEKAHHKHNVPNAFRHALWNVLIAKNCYVKNNSIEKSVDWAKKVTDMHEKLAPNSNLEMLMDLHNNEIGRMLFLENSLHSENTDRILSVIKEKMETAVKVGSPEEIKKSKKEFVYLEDL